MKKEKIKVDNKLKGLAIEKRTQINIGKKNQIKIGIGKVIGNLIGE